MIDRCPSCAASLDNEGICTSCGALSRGFFRELDLGAPQLAAAVARGLDFYRLLGVTAGADTRAIARQYRQLRAMFPDDPANLAEEPARRLALLEHAGRALTDPQLRLIYDELRVSGGSADLHVLRCEECAAPLSPEAPRCGFCGTPRPPERPAPPAPPEEGPPAAEPVDYYALLGLDSGHLAHNEERRAGHTDELLFDLFTWDAARPTPDARPIQGVAPGAADVDASALGRQRETLLMPGLEADEREARLDEYEIARRILRDPRRRGAYDALLLDFRRGKLDRGRLEALRHLQDEVRAELAEERGEQMPAAEGAALLRQGLGYVRAGLAREAVAALRRAVAALPDSSEAHAAYARAILAADDPLLLGGHALRQAQQSLARSQALGATGENTTALLALVRGLLARDMGDSTAAEAELREATRLKPQLGPAWRGLAALALERGAIDAVLECCRHALAADPRDERALLIMAGASLRAGRRAQAREAAAQAAALRGEDWTAEMVLRELAG